MHTFVHKISRIKISVKFFVDNSINVSTSDGDKLFKHQFIKVFK